jgi:hypothetical protein
MEIVILIILGILWLYYSVYNRQKMATYLLLTLLGFSALYKFPKRFFSDVSNGESLIIFAIFIVGATIIYYLPPEN